MASGIPTRRVRRVDENAPPAAPKTTATRPPTTASTIPVMKRTNSSLSTRDANAKPATAAATGKVVTRRRAALGEIPVADNTKPDKGKGAATGERRPLASKESSQALRRTTRATTSEAARPEDRALATKRKAGISTTTRRPALSRNASTASFASTSTGTTTSTTLRPSRQLKETASLTDAAPSPKRIRKSTPEDDVLDAVYDADHKEVAVRTPKREVAKDAGWTDLDLEDEGDPAMVSEYVIDAFHYMMELEKTTMPNPDYMDDQDELQWKMRTILHDWIIEVHSKFRLLPETLLIATNLIDRFLSVRTVSMIKFQLVGLTALFVAAKYEEVICPSITHFLHMTDGGYEVQEILRAERYLLSTLNFDLSFPNPLHFLRRVSKADGYDVHARTVAKYFIEISCIEHRLLPFPPSMLAAAAMWLARLCLDRGPWHANMVHYSTYAQHELLECAQVMLTYVVKPDMDTTSAFHKKYASKKHLKASVFVRDWAIHRWPNSAKGQSPNQGRELLVEYGGIQVAPPPATP